MASLPEEADVDHCQLIVARQDGVLPIAEQHLDGRDIFDNWPEHTLDYRKTRRSMVQAVFDGDAGIAVVYSQRPSGMTFQRLNEDDGKSKAVSTDLRTRLGRRLVQHRNEGFWALHPGL